MRRHIVAGNWKMNKSFHEGIQLVKDLQNILINDKPNCQVIVAPPFIHLTSLATFTDPQIIGIASQNIANHDSGAYTGEVSATMVASTGATYTIIGHSERRIYYGENHQILADKITLALEACLTPIFCVGEQLEDRVAGRHFQVVSEQLDKALFSLDKDQFKGIIVAYEPVWAIGTGKTATHTEANDMHKHIRGLISEKYGQDIADDTSILYGGSCKADNARQLFGESDIDGGLIGGASLNANDFISIIRAFNS